MPYDALDDQDEMDSQPIQQLRAQYDALEKDLKAERKAKEAAERRISEMEARQKTELAQSLFKQQGLNPSFGELFLKANPEADVTLEAINAFATDYGLVPPASADETDAGEEVKQPTLVPVPGTLPPTQLMEIGAWKALYQKNPTQALNLAEQGLVALPE